MVKTLLLVLSFVILASFGYWQWYQQQRQWVSPIPVAIQQLPLATIHQNMQRCAWMPWWDEGNGLTSARQAGKQLRIVSPVWFQLDEAGKLHKQARIQEAELLQLAKEFDWLIMPTISNADDQGFDDQRVTKLLSDPVSRQSLIELLVAAPPEYAGWDLDWEEVARTDREAFTQWVTELAQRLHQTNKLLSVTVHAKTGAWSDWVGTQGQDWQSLGHAADYIRVMAYDYHYSGSAPGPVTPLGWLDEVLRYATSQVVREKLAIGLPLYGYDWPVQSRVFSQASFAGKPITYQEAERLIELYDGQIERDSRSQTLKVEYRSDDQNHEVWFEDAKSLEAKERLVYAYGINSVCLWRLGGEDERVWRGT